MIKYKFLSDWKFYIMSIEHLIIITINNYIHRHSLVSHFNIYNFFNYSILNSTLINVNNIYYVAPLRKIIIQLELSL